jgi:hypothetical protein
VRRAASPGHPRALAARGDGRSDRRGRAGGRDDRQICEVYAKKVYRDREGEGRTLLQVSRL